MLPLNFIFPKRVISIGMFILCPKFSLINLMPSACIVRLLISAIQRAFDCQLLTEPFAERYILRPLTRRLVMRVEVLVPLTANERSILFLKLCSSGIIKDRSAGRITEGSRAKEYCKEGSWSLSDSNE